MSGLQITGWRQPKKGTARRTVSGCIAVYSGLGGELLCHAVVTDAVEVQELKSAIVQAEGTPLELQRLLVGAKELRNYEALSRVLDRAHPQVALVRGAGSDVLKSLELGRLDLKSSPYLAGERELVLAAVQHSSEQLQYATEELRNDCEVVLAAVGSPGQRGQPPLAYAAKVPRADREVVVASVQKRGAALAFAAEELRRDRGVVLSAVQQDGLALEHAAESLQADSGVVVEALRSTWQAFQFAAASLRGERELVFAVVREDGLLLQHATEVMKQDREVVAAAVMQNYAAFQHAALELRSNVHFILHLIRDCRVEDSVVWFAEERLKDNPDTLVYLMEGVGLERYDMRF